MNAYSICMNTLCSQFGTCHEYEDYAVVGLWGVCLELTHSTKPNQTWTRIIQRKCCINLFSWFFQMLYIENSYQAAFENESGWVVWRLLAGSERCRTSVRHGWGLLLVQSLDSSSLSLAAVNSRFCSSFLFSGHRKFLRKVEHIHRCFHWNHAHWGLFNEKSHKPA